MNHTTQLGKLYWRKRGFSEYRSEREADMFSPDNPTNALHTELHELREKRKNLLAELDGQIAVIRNKILAAGESPNKTDRTRALHEELRLEKKQLDKDFAEMVLARMAHGETIPDMCKEVGATNSTFFYQVTASQRFRDTVREPSDIVRDDEEWTYHDFTGTHRYAFNQDHTLVKFHAPDVEDGHSLLTWPEGLHYAGDRTNSERFEKNRAEVLESILAGTYEGVLRESPNPYKA